MFKSFLVENFNFKKYFSEMFQTVNNQFKCSFEKYLLKLDFHQKRGDRL